jgi:hypothetical protein
VYMVDLRESCKIYYPETNLTLGLRDSILSQVQGLGCVSPARGYDARGFGVGALGRVKVQPQSASGMRRKLLLMNEVCLIEANGVKQRLTLTLLLERKGFEQNEAFP